MTIRMMTGLLVLAGLSACKPVATTNNVSAVLPANVTAPAPIAVNTSGNSAATAPALTTAFLTGIWAEGGCETPNVRLNADGTTDGGRWRLEGDRIIRTTPTGEDPPLTVAALAPDRMSVRFEDLPPIVMTRCPA